MLRTSLLRGVEGKFGVDSARLLADVTETIRSANGCSLVLVNGEGEKVGCFMARLEPHAYCRGNVVRELGCFIMDDHRGHGNFEKLLDAYLAWATTMPDVLLTTFTIGQLGATTPYIRSVLNKRGFTKGDEGYYL